MKKINIRSIKHKLSHASCTEKPLNPVKGIIAAGVAIGAGVGLSGALVAGSLTFGAASGTL